MSNVAELPSLTRILVARHGNTFGPGDVVTRVGGRTDIPLVESGLHQGLALGKYLKQEKLIPTVVFTSELKRTLQTADKILEGMGQSIPLHRLRIFNEIDYGPDENRPESEVIARLGEPVLKQWDEDGIVPAGWQVDVNAIRAAWIEFGKSIRRDYPGQAVLVVTSNGIARFAPVLTGDFDGFKAKQKLKIATGAICRFDAEGSTWRCVSWNIRP